MAKLTGPIKFTGKLDGISAHKRIGSEGIILRPRYGPSKKDIDTKPSYANTKRENYEFGGRSTAAKWIHDGYLALKPVSDGYNLSRLNALLKPIQDMDTQSKYGKRSVALSYWRELLEGFQLSKWYSFESVLRSPIDCSLSREQLMATVLVPSLLPSVNFVPPTEHAFFRVVATLNIVPDLYFNEIKYRPGGNYDAFRPEVVKTEWMAVESGTEAIILKLQMPEAPPDEEFSLVLTLGIEMGTAKSKVLIQGVKYAGCGKILTVG
jgi:hypothetical protein